jgi:hypothetical protein
VLDCRSGWGAFICHFVLRKWQNEVPWQSTQSNIYLVLLVRDRVFLQQS